MYLNRKNSFNRLLIMLVVLLATGFTSFAQPFNNEWIDFNKTYYKFKVGADGLYRIPAASLSTIGLNSTPAEHFRLYRNGVEVPIFTSVNSGILPADGYIEFWGLANDGTTDRILYREEQFQHRTKYNLHVDTAIYFLTVESSLPNKRFSSVNNDVASNTLPVEPYFIHKLARDYKERLNPGFAADLEQYVFSSSYDRGEFFSSNEIRQRITRTDNQTNLRPFVGGPDGTLQFGAFGNTTKTRRVRVELNGNQLYENSMNFFSDLVATVPVPNALLATGAASVAFTNVQPPAPATGPDPYLDRMVISFYELTYAREFNFNNARTFAFELQPRTNGYFLEIRNFNSGGVAPVLYDLENQERYVANTQVAGVFRFALPGSVNTRKLVMVSQASATGYPNIVNAFSSRTFTDYSNAALQGDYLIISNKVLLNGPDGSNPVEDYRQYRSSATGGGFNAKIYDIEELTDQFAFGQEGHPLSIKNFIRFARANFSSPLQNVFLIGKGVTYNYYRASNNITMRPQLKELNLLPTFGFPGSDNLMSSASSSDPIIQTPIGRLSVIRPAEVTDYLEKVKEYEQVQKTVSGQIEDQIWKKNILHVTGATDALLGVQLCNFMNLYKTLIDDTLTGANATVLCKTVGGQQDQSGAQVIRNQFESGISLLTYFGHSSANTLEFSIEDPNDYNNQGKYPVFSVNGCYAGDFFQYSAGRFQVYETLTEKFTLAKQRGGVAFIASTHFGVVNYLGVYLTSFYNQIGKTDYGRPLGVVNKDALVEMKQRYSPIDFLARAHAEQVNLHGDPALVMNFQEKPDYAVEESTVEISPSFISVSDQTFNVKVKYYNIGKAINDSVNVEVKRINPDGTEVVLYNQKRLAPKLVDSLEFQLPIISTIHKGQGRIAVVIDGEERISEMVEDNNSISKTFFIYEDEASPAFPYNYSIVTEPSQKFYASTANPFSSMKQYIMEIDTTTNFNSSLKKTVTISSEGGLLEFDPQMSFQDSVVYYWRTALVPGEGGEFVWNVSSFQYRANGQFGFNQSHFYQHKESEIQQMTLAEGNKWDFGIRNNSVQVRHGIYPTSGLEDNDFSVVINDDDFIKSACLGRSLIFIVIDPKTMVPWKNVDENGQNLNRFGSASANCAPSRNYNFEFSYMTAASRKLMMDMMDSIPDGYYVIVRSIDYANNASYSSTWRADTALYGSNNSLYHKLLNAGFTNIDEVNAPKCWGLIYKKNDPSFVPQTRVSAGLYDRFFISTNAASPDSIGLITSPRFGPAKSWKELRWEGKYMETGDPDEVTIQLLGIRGDNNPVVLREINADERIVDISDINAETYPYVQLYMRNKDAVNYTPFQLSYWKLIYDPVPEGAIVPKLYLSAKDTADIGEPVNFGIAFKNITSVAFDSLKVKVTISDANNVTTELPVQMQKPLPGQDTLRFNYTIDTKNYPGLNTLFVDFNPDFHQPEQYRFNNFLFRNLFVKGDNTNPLLDVTFDGVHILNGDIVSAKPRIQIKLKDESKFLLLKDTSLMRIQVKFPDGTIRNYRFDNDTVRFTPAVAGTDNTATIDFTPAFLQTFDQESGIDSYELTVVGKDASENTAGRAGYSIEFKVVNKPMISNLLNYPNPFSTSTAFVFTLTGSEIPTNFKIQILTVTGKVVREITGDELGPLRIGRNITEYKWDGTDQFGQRLANGVYLYRVVSTLNGIKMDKFRADGDNTDKYFTRGYGKMYLIR